MPWMNFDLNDGKPPVGFSLKTDDADRFMDFMADCQALKQDRGEVVVTKNAAGVILAVTRQNSEGRILSVIAESAPPR